MDLRFPIGLLFSAFGVLLTGYALWKPDLRAPLATVNVNLYAGLCLLAFGVSMILLAWKARK
jgi:hypothetical protein